MGKFYSAGDDGSGGAVTPGAGTTPNPTPAGSGNPSGEQQAKTFTQEELDAIVTDRLSRERKKYEGFDDIKRRAAEYDKLTEAQKTESERLNGELAQLKDQLTAAQRRERDYALRDAIDSVVRAEDFGHTLQAPVADVIHFLDADLDATDEKAVKAALKGMTQSKAYLFAEKAKRTGSVDGGANGTTTVNPGFGLDRLRHGYETATQRR